MALRRRTYEIVEAAQADDRASKVFDLTIISLIFVNVIAFVLESVDSIQAAAPLTFLYLEYASVAVFSIEYLLRLWSCVEAPGYSAALTGRTRFLVRPMMMVDLLSILPTLLPMFGVDLRVFRALRMFRLVRIAKLGRYTMALQVIQRVLQGKKEELVTTLSFLVMLLLLASSVLYFAERGAQPEKFGSIPQAMWWGVATLTTVGYGDVFPITMAGKVLGAGIAILGIGMFALPTGILGAAFVEEVQRRKAETVVCPHCGEALDANAGATEE